MHAVSCERSEGRREQATTWDEIVCKMSRPPITASWVLISDHRVVVHISSIAIGSGQRIGSILDDNGRDEVFMQRTTVLKYAIIKRARDRHILEDNSVHAHLT